MDLDSSSASGSGAAAAATPWGTLEELLLVGAISRHGAGDWNVVACELQNRAKLFTMPASYFSPEACKSKFDALSGRYGSHRSIGRDKEPENHWPWFEEIRKRRIAQLKRELERHDGSIMLLTQKLKRLKTERQNPHNKQQDAKPLMEKPEEEVEAATTCETLTPTLTPKSPQEAEETEDEVVPVEPQEPSIADPEEVQDVKDSPNPEVEVEVAVDAGDANVAVDAGNDGNVGVDAGEAETTHGSEETQVEDAKVKDDDEKVDVHRVTISEDEMQGKTTTETPEVDAMDVDDTLTTGGDDPQQPEVDVHTSKSIEAAAEEQDQTIPMEAITTTTPMETTPEDEADEKQVSSGGTGAPEESSFVEPASEDMVEGPNPENAGAFQGLDTNPEKVEASQGEEGDGNAMEAAVEPTSRVDEDVPSVPEPVDDNDKQPEKPVEEEETVPEGATTVPETVPEDVTTVPDSGDIPTTVPEEPEAAAEAPKGAEEKSDESQVAAGRAPEAAFPEKMEATETTTTTKDDLPPSAEEANVAAGSAREHDQSKDDHSKEEAKDRESRMEKSETCSRPDVTDDTSPTSRRSKKSEVKLPVVMQAHLDWLKSLCNHKLGPMFLQRQESQENPRYDQLIKRHLDLNVIKGRMEEGGYSSSWEFFRDVLLMFTNYEVFYPRSSEEFKAAVVLKKIASEEMNRAAVSEAAAAKLEKEKPGSTRRRESSSARTKATTVSPGQTAATKSGQTMSENSKSKSASASAGVRSSRGGDEDDTREGGEPEVSGKSKPLRAYGRKNRSVKESPLEAIVKKEAAIAAAKDAAGAVVAPATPAASPAAAAAAAAAAVPPAAAAPTPTSSGKGRSSGSTKEKKSSDGSKSKGKGAPAVSEAEVPAAVTPRGARNKRTAKDFPQRTGKRSRRI